MDKNTVFGEHMRCSLIDKVMKLQGGSNANWVSYEHVHESMKSTRLMIERLQVWILAEVVGDLSSLELSVCWLLLGVCSTSVLLQWHVKDPGHSAKSAGGRLHLNMYTLLTQWSRSWLAMLLSRRSVWVYPETSSHAICQGTLGPSRLSSLSHCGLIMSKKKKVQLLCAS